MSATSGQNTPRQRVLPPATGKNPFWCRRSIGCALGLRAQFAPDLSETANVRNGSIVAGKGGKQTLELYDAPMRSWAVWYRTLVITWAVVGLPGLVLGYGFSGRDFALPTGDLLSGVVWLVVVFFIVSPILLWPWRKDGRRRGFY